MVRGHTSLSLNSDPVPQSRFSSPLSCRGYLLGTVTAVAVIVLFGAPVGDVAIRHDQRTITESCDTAHPYYAATTFGVTTFENQWEIVAFQDSPAVDSPTRISLAAKSQVGSVYGLAYDWRRQQLY